MEFINASAYYVTFSQGKDKGKIFGHTNEK